MDQAILVALVMLVCVLTMLVLGNSHQYQHRSGLHHRHAVRASL